MIYKSKKEKVFFNSYSVIDVKKKVRLYWRYEEVVFLLLYTHAKLNDSLFENIFFFENNEKKKTFKKSLFLNTKKQRYINGQRDMDEGNFR